MMSKEYVDRLDSFGDYFVYNKIREKYGISFERFVQMVDRGTWQDSVGA